MKVKIISAIGNVINLSVDGVPYSYYIGRPAPLTPKDMQVVLDRSFLVSLGQSYNEIRPWSYKLRDILKRFFFRLGRPKTTYAATFMNQEFVEWLRQNAVLLEVEGQECLVLTPGMLEKIERGELE